jgi:hypothetical protein
MKTPPRLSQSGYYPLRLPPTLPGSTTMVPRRSQDKQRRDSGDKEPRQGKGRDCDVETRTSGATLSTQHPPGARAGVDLGLMDQHSRRRYSPAGTATKVSDLDVVAAAIPFECSHRHSVIPSLPYGTTIRFHAMPRQALPCLASVLQLVAVLADVLPADGDVGATFAETEAHTALTDVERQPVRLPGP